MISAADIDLTSIQFLYSPAVLNDIKAELPAYLAAAEDILNVCENARYGNNG